MPVSISALTLLVTGPDGTHQVLVGSDERAYRRAFGAFVEAWGEDAVWYDDERKMLGSTGGVALSRWRARVLGERPSMALLVLVDEVPVGIYLVDDEPMAERAVTSLDRDDVHFELVAVEPLPPADDAVDSAPLPGTVRIRRGGPRPLAPKPALSDVFCERCEDHPLHVDPMFDGLTADGRRVCVACARLASLRESAERE